MAIFLPKKVIGNMRERYFFDTKNFLSKINMEDMGFTYLSIGNGSVQT